MPDSEPVPPKRSIWDFVVFCGVLFGALSATMAVFYGLVVLSAWILARTLAS